jgi:predicted MFS family arabinose efflux permease
MLQRATRSVYLIFGLTGVFAATMVARVPQIRDTLHLQPGALGILLLMVAVGSVISLPLAGTVVHRLGPSRAVRTMCLVAASGVAIAGLGLQVSVYMSGAGFLFAGFGVGTWDVAMNVEGAAVEQQLGRSVMARFHAAFSLGTVCGGLIGAAMNALNVGPTPHIVVVAVIVGLSVFVLAGGFMPVVDDEHSERHNPFDAWKEPRTLLIGLFVLTMAFTEGTGNDWLGVAAIDGYHASKSMGSLVYVLFVASMTTGRWFGPHLLDRFGRVPVMRATAALAAVGVAIVVWGPSMTTVFIGTLLWGAGTSLGFPTGMSAASDDQAKAAGRVSVVATIGYVAFLAGPSAIGWIGNHTGVRKALLVTGVMALLAFANAGSTRKITPVDSPQTSVG